jgi:hypothetical protein
VAKVSPISVRLRLPDPVAGGKVECSTTGSTRTAVSTAYLRTIQRFGMFSSLFHLLALTIRSGLRMRLSTIRCFTKAMKYGNKFIYQTVPRLLTIWLDMGEDDTVNMHECFIKISAEISRSISGVPAFKVSSGVSLQYLHLTHSSGIPHSLKSLPVLVINTTPSSRSWRV